MRRRTRQQITIAEHLTAAKVRGVGPAAGEENGRAAVRRERGRLEIAADVARGDVIAASMREARERAAADKRAARLLELRRAGKTLVEAFQIIDREMPEPAKEITDDAEEPDDDPRYP